MTLRYSIFLTQVSARDAATLLLFGFAVCFLIAWYLSANRQWLRTGLTMFYITFWFSLIVYYGSML